MGKAAERSACGSSSASHCSRVSPVLLALVLPLAGVLGWIERKGSALIQDRIGANRASIFGFAGFGLVNTLMADPLKFLTKEDVIPAAPTASCTRWRPASASSRRWSPSR